MTDDLKVFRELILWLWQSHKKLWEYDNQQIQLIVQTPELQAASFSADTELAACLPSHDKVDASFPDKRYLYLSPVTKGRIMVPRMHLKCNFGRNIPEVRCRLELFLLANNSELQSLGYRFESPEGKNDQDAGIHHYYHVQLIQPPTSSVEWLPEKQPSFPLNADNPVKLILSLLISLYGLDYLGTISRDAGIQDLDKYIKKIACIEFGAIEWYRLVEIGNPIKHMEGYRFTAAVTEFETDIRKKYPGCKIRGISHTKYAALKGAEQKKYP